MKRATALSNHRCISSEDVQGTEVYGPDGKNIGHSHYPIPWGALSYDKSLGGFRTNITEEQLRDAPEFSDDSWQDRDWETRTHRHYGAPEYWETRTGM